MTIQVATVLPSLLNDGLSESAWSLDEPIGEFEPAYGFGPGQVVRYETARWRVRLRFESLSQVDRHLLARFLAACGRHRSWWMFDPSHNLRGVFPSSELIVPGATFTGTHTITTDSDGVRATRAVASGYVASPALTVTANAFYAWRALLEISACAAGATFVPYGASTASGTNYGTGSASATGGRFALKCSPTGATMYVNVYSGSWAAEANWSTTLPFAVLRRPSVVRAFLVDGGGGAQTQSGTGLYVRGLVLSTAAQLRAGDMVEIVSGAMSQMLRVTEDVDGDGNGKGWMKFEPMLRQPVSDGDLVIPYRPWVRLRMVTSPELLTRPGWYSNCEIEAMETFV